MKLVRALACSASIFALALATSTPLRADLITNGGFESGAFAPAWTTLNSVGITTNANNVYAGTHAAFLSSNNAQLNQTVAGTVIGQQYTLGFVVGNRNSSGTNDLQVSWDGATVLHLVNTFLAPAPYAAPYSFTVTATATSTPLSIKASNSTSFWLLDQVTLTPVPEPGSLTLALSAAGLGMLGYATRRARSRWNPLSQLPRHRA